jgi:hypothetical protein
MLGILPRQGGGSGLSGVLGVAAWLGEVGIMLFDETVFRTMR